MIPVSAVNESNAPLSLAADAKESCAISFSAVGESSDDPMLQAPNTRMRPTNVARVLVCAFHCLLLFGSNERRDPCVGIIRIRFMRSESGELPLSPAYRAPVVQGYMRVHDNALKGPICAHAQTPLGDGAERDHGVVTPETK